MTGIIIVSITLLVTVVAVRVGGLALELTGMPRDAARFQALSAFTNTGFTTRAAEDVVRHPQRRKIITTLIMVGWVGIASIITGLLQTFRVESFSATMLPQFGGVLLCLAILYRILILPRLAAAIDRYLKRQLERHTGLEPAEIEEVLLQAEGWGIARIEMLEDCQLVGMPLEQSRPRDMGILVIAIERGDALIPSPGGRDYIYVGDRLLAYGPMATMGQVAGRFSPSGALAREG